MGVKEDRRKDAESGRIAELKKNGYICTLEDGKPYVFISYSSRDWDRALREVIYNTCNKYGLRIYFDTNFDEGSDSWLTQFYDNMADENCKSVLAFFSPDYESSYACLMELMASQTGDVSKLVLPIVLGNTEVTSKENSGLGTLRFADNSLNNLWDKELDKFNKFFNELAHDKKNKAITDKEAALHSIYMNHDKKEPYKERLNLQKLKGNGAYWESKGIDSDEDKERYWNETLTKEDKNKSGEMYLSKKNCARLVNEIRSNLDKNDIDNVNKAVEDAIYNKLKDSGFASGANSVFDESLIGKLGTETVSVITETPVDSEPLKQDHSVITITPDGNNRGEETDTDMIEPTSDQVTIKPDGKICSYGSADKKYYAFYYQDEAEKYTILRGSRIVVYAKLSDKVKVECKERTNENNFLLCDITGLARSTAAKIITGNSTAGDELESDKNILKNEVVVDLNSPMPFEPEKKNKKDKGGDNLPPKESLNKLLNDFMDKYSEEVQGRKVASTEAEKEKYKPGEGNWMYDMVCKDIPAKVAALLPLNKEKYECKSSVGRGGWADCPWVAVFNKYITQSTQQGIYVVYLLNPKMKELYLTLNQGTTQFEEMANEIGIPGLRLQGYKKKEDYVFAKIKESTTKIRGEVETGQFSHEHINMPKEGYALGCVCSKKYTLENLPADEILIADLREMLDVYDQYYELHKNEYPSTIEKGSAMVMSTADGKSVVDKPLF